MTTDQKVSGLNPDGVTKSPFLGAFFWHLPQPTIDEGVFITIFSKND